MPGVVRPSFLSWHSSTFELCAAYSIQACVLGLDMVVFIAGSKTYVKHPPEKTALTKTFNMLEQQIVCKQFDTSQINLPCSHPPLRDRKARLMDASLMRRDLFRFRF
jgi:hypothetical protein